jgi:copper chaperone NosL
MWEKLDMSKDFIAASLTIASLFLGGCGSSEVKPIDIFAKDNCVQCRMAVSDERFASEIINDVGDVMKFDDLGCLLKWRTQHHGTTIVATFVKEYDTRQWIPYERAVIIETDVDTPMGSGKVAFGDSMKAREFQKKHPPSKALSEAGCGGGCCGGTN